MTMTSGKPSKRASRRANPLRIAREVTAELRRRVHGNDRGAMSVLVLLTIWCIVGLMSMVWNTAEYATRRQQMQNAADSAAHTSATWMTRSLNAIAAQNMVIGQDASAEVIARAVNPTDEIIAQELMREKAGALALMNGQDPRWLRMRQTLAGLVTRVETTYDLLYRSLSSIGADAATVEFADKDKNDKIKFLNSIRQAQEASTWIENVYFGGGSGFGGQPYPPGPNGEGLKQLAQKWQNTALTKDMLAVILAAIANEQQVLSEFEGRTASAPAQTVITEMAGHEQKVFDDESAMAEAVPDTIIRQQKQLSTFYNAKITVASVDPRVESYPDQVPSPVKLPATVQWVSGYPDSIRHSNTADAEAAGLPLDVDIDPINPHTGINRIWYPTRQVFTPNLTPIKIPPMYTPNVNEPGGWGHAWAFPVEHYVAGRIWKDYVTLNTDYMVVIDKIRSDLAKQLNAMAGVTALGVAPLPSQIQDTQPDPITGQTVNIPILPKLSVPLTGKTTNDIKTEIDYTYKEYSAGYLRAVRRLAAALRDFGEFFNPFTIPLAVPTWHGQIVRMRDVVLQNLGTAGTFMVTAGYQLHAIPDWAKSNMQESLYRAVYDKIIWNNAANDRLWIDYDLFHDPVLIPYIDAAAHNIAYEMVNRPWPYEMTPPDQIVPPSRGMSKIDRQTFYSVVAAVESNEVTTPKLLFGNYLSLTNTPIVAYAQGEAFNWMEYNANYGLNERYDEVQSDGFGYFMACPKAWRLSSPGGWNWQPRLSYSDVLARAMVASPELGTFMKDGGVENADADSLKIVNLH